MLGNSLQGSSRCGVGSSRLRCIDRLAPRQPVKSSKHALNEKPVLAASAAVTTEHAEPEQEEPPQQQQQQQEASLKPSSSQNYTKTRTKRLARDWQDSSTPNTGLVTITARSKIGPAAACVAADFKTNRITRVVPQPEGMAHRAITTIALANKMLNTRLQQEQESQGQPHKAQALVVQPVEVVGALAQPPALPLGAIVLYVSPLAAGDSVLRAVLRKRSAAIGAAEVQAGQDAAPVQRAQPSSTQVYVSRASDYERVAGALSQAIQRLGWVELVVFGRFDQTAPVVLQALVKLRRIRHGVFKDDVSAVLLGDEEVLGPQGCASPQAIDGFPPPVSFLVLRCKKNFGNGLLPLQVERSN